MHSQRTDVSSRKEGWADDEAIGREGEPSLIRLEIGSIMVTGQFAAGEVLAKDVAQEASGHPSAAAVRQEYPIRGASCGGERASEIHCEIAGIGHQAIAASEG
jgi:hypothetical protein